MAPQTCLLDSLGFIDENGISVTSRISLSRSRGGYLREPAGPPLEAPN